MSRLKDVSLSRRGSAQVEQLLAVEAEQDRSCLAVEELELL